ncbi:hypothetical protein D3C83_49700 [compost metagenome]
MWSIESPATSGPVKVVADPVRLKLLKLRGRSSGLLSVPTRFCRVTWKNASARPFNAAAT